MGRDPKGGRVTLVRSCCMVIINYFDTFNVKLIGYPFPRNVFLRIDLNRYFKKSNNNVLPVITIDVLLRHYCSGMLTKTNLTARIANHYDVRVA